VTSGLHGFVQSRGDYVQSISVEGILSLIVQEIVRISSRNKFDKYCENSLEIQDESGSVPFALDMLTTGATSATKRPQGGVGARKFAVATLSIFLLFAGFFATAQRASADTGIPPSGATGAMTDSAAGVPPGSTTAIPPPAAGNDATAAPVDISQPTAQDAATAQAATADAAAAQPQQSNAIGATRADSSGDDSASQQNDVSVVGAAANAASTDQTAGSPSPPGAAEGGQQAATDQAANAAAAAVQPQQSNVVIIIRINSPGDDVISQTNVVSVVAVAANQSSTSQNPAPAGVSAPGAADSPQSSSDASSVPSTDGQPVQSGGQPAKSAGAKQQPQQPADAVQQHRLPVRALSILAFAASSSASLPTPEHKATSSTTSASRPRAEGAAGRSGVFGPNTTAAEGSDRASVESDPSSIQAARPQAQGSRGAALGAVRDRVASWLGRTAVATHPQLPAESARGMSLGLMTLTALLVGLLGWAALSWPVFPRR
jgi:hypothetical protein